MFVAIGQDSHQFSLSTKEYYNQSGVIACRKREKRSLDNNTAISTLQRSLPRRRCSSPEAYKTYLATLLPELSAMLKFYGTAQRRNDSFRRYHLRQRLITRVCQNILQSGKQTVVFAGDAGFNVASPGHMASPRSRMLKALSEFPGITVVPTDEFRTSVLCSRCLGRLDTRHPRQSWRLKDCPSCHVRWNRDVNAAVNILHVGLEMQRSGGVRPEAFCRS